MVRYSDLSLGLKWMITLPFVLAMIYVFFFMLYVAVFFVSDLT